MAIQSEIFSTSFGVRSFASTKHIATKQHMAVWLKRISDNVWVQLSVNKFELINNSAVLDEAPSASLYSQVEIRVADEPDELGESQSDIATVASIASEIKQVVLEVIPNLPEILLADDIANIETLSELSTINPSVYTTAIVKDIDRGGTFIWSSTGTANGGTVFAGVRGYWHRQYSGAVNVKWFGAKGDGVADDTDNINLATTFGDIFIPFGNFISTRTTLLNYSGDGVVYTSSALTTINEKFNKKGNIGGNINRNHFQIGCIPRCTAGEFSNINDSGHHPLNVASITQPDDYTIRVNYAKSATKINSFMIQQDNELAPYGIDIGGDVGLSYANTKGYTNWNGYTNGTTINANVLISDDSSASISNNVLTVVHGTAVTNDVPVASVVYKTPSNTMQIGVGYNSGAITVTALSDLSGYISYNGSNWSVQLTNNDPTDATFVFSAPTSGGTIKLSHALCSDYNVQLTAHGITYRVALVDVGSSSFEIAFIDNAGNLITTPNINMKLWFRRKALVKSTYPTTMGVLLRRGNVPIKSSRFSNVAGNNFWVHGTMEY